MSDPDDGGDGEPDARTAERTPNVLAMAFWDDVVADMEATADEYESDGWETAQLHPGDVTVLPGETPDGEETAHWGLDVLVPDNEFDDLAALFDRGVSFDACQVFKGDAGGVVFLVVAMEDSAAEVAVLYPVYYRHPDPDTTALFERADEAGALFSYLRRLGGEYVELRHDDPTLFEPPAVDEE